MAKIIIDNTEIPVVIGFIKDTMKSLADPTIPEVKTFDFAKFVKDWNATGTNVMLNKTMESGDILSIEVEIN
jgi:hypothetical protein